MNRNFPPFWDLLIFIYVFLSEHFKRLIKNPENDALARLTAPYWFESNGQKKENSNNKPTCVITGANAGIGKETAIYLARVGMNVILGCRNKQKGEETVKEIQKISGNKNVELILLDLESLQSIRKFCQTINSRGIAVHVLINNAGMLPGKLRKSEDGIEASWQTNHVGPFYLTKLLLPALKRATPSSRIISVASSGHWLSPLERDDLEDITFLQRKYLHRALIYGDAKLANILFIRELQRRLETEESRGDILALSLHPGVVASELYRAYLPGFLLMLLKTVQQGARTQIYLSLAPAEHLKKGGYYDECEVASMSDKARDSLLAKFLWDQTTKLLQAKKLI